jgi:ribosomal protein S18 acetylase RimI-like enzyme
MSRWPFLLCLPNLNELLVKMRSGKLFPFNFIKILTRKKKIKSARVITVAVKKAYQHLGIGSLLYPEIMKRGIQCNYTTSELSWVAEDNDVMKQIAAGLCADRYKTYRLYVRQL